MSGGKRKQRKQEIANRKARKEQRQLELKRNDHWYEKQAQKRANEGGTSLSLEESLSLLQENIPNLRINTGEQTIAVYKSFNVFMEREMNRVANVEYSITQDGRLKLNFGDDFIKTVRIKGLPNVFQIYLREYLDKVQSERYDEYNSRRSNFFY